MGICCKRGRRGEGAGRFSEPDVTSTDGRKVKRRKEKRKNGMRKMKIRQIVRSENGGKCFL